jgi:RNA polymerase sigma-70 factor (ECF subfamily)
MKPEPAPAPSKARVETSPEERDWIARCRAGDARAYRVLVERYQDRAYALAYRMVRSRPDAEEIAQDAFVRAWRAIGDFRGDATFMTWLYRILVRLALDRAETLKNRRAREIVVEDPEEPVAAAAPDGSVARLLDRLLADCRPLARDAHALLLRGPAGRGAVLNMPENTVKTREPRPLLPRAASGKHAREAFMDDRDRSAGGGVLRPEPGRSGAGWIRGPRDGAGDDDRRDRAGRGLVRGGGRSHRRSRSHGGARPRSRRIVVAGRILGAAALVSAWMERRRKPCQGSRPTALLALLDEPALHRSLVWGAWRATEQALIVAMTGRHRS